jgi:hypothetical protein
MAPPKEAREVKVGDKIVDGPLQHTVQAVTDYGNMIGITASDNGREHVYPASQKIEVSE